MYNDRDNLDPNLNPNADQMDQTDQDADTDLDQRGAANQGKGGMRKLGGKLQEAAGKVTGKDDWEAQGKMKQAEGTVQEGWGKAERKADDALNP
ncbi:MAG: CsbD family protein [Ktedonobacterales bacterium]